MDHPISCAAPSECIGRCGFLSALIHDPNLDSMMSINEDSHQDDAPTKGILVIDKPLNITSMGVCSVVRGRLKAGGAPKRIKVGHGGTLDPLATGVLVILIGKATKMCDEIMDGVKGYLTTIDLSCTSTTDDLEGEQAPVIPDQIPTREDVERACAAWVGEVQQTPPIYSAIKVDGQRAYALARKGEEVSLKARTIRIDSIEVVEYEWPSLKIDVVCGKGTYIRSLGRDIGALMGAGGMLTALRRTRVGQFTLDDAITLDEVPNPYDPALVSMALLDRA